MISAMKKTRLYLVRHGQVEGHEEKRYNGQSDVALTELGRQQMDRMGEILGRCPLKAVYSSDLSRCLYGAERLATKLRIPVRSDAALRELDCGDWQGRPWSELQAEFPAEWRTRLQDVVHYRFPGGESFADAAQRVRPVVRNLIDQHPGQEIALFGHGGLNRILLLDAMVAPLASAFRIVQDFACLNIIDYHADGNTRLRLMNGSHLLAGSWLDAGLMTG